MGSEQLAWSGRNWRMPAWLWIGLATMFVSALHIILDFGVGLFDLHGIVGTRIALERAVVLRRRTGFASPRPARGRRRTLTRQLTICLR